MERTTVYTVEERAGVSNKLSVSQVALRRLYEAKRR